MNQNCIITEPAIPVHLFIREGDNFFGEASTVGFRGSRQVFNDAIDTGIVVSGSNAVGQHRFFPYTLAEVVRDQEGDIQAWKFKNLRGTSTITIFND